MSEVFVTDSASLGDHKFLVAAHLPRRHAFFGDGYDGRVDPMLCLEVTRQSCTLVAHRYYGIPVGWQFVMTTSSLEVTDQSALDDITELARPLVEIQVTDREPGRGVPNVLRVDATFVIEDRAVIRFVGGLLAVESSIYRQLRRESMRRAAGRPGSQAGAPLPASLAGRLDTRNVVLSPAPHSGDTDYRAELIVDRTHPVFFDHPLDHVPGTLLVEAHRQAATAALRRLPGRSEPRISSAELRFDGFVELDVHTPVVARVSDPGREADEVTVHTEIAQCGAVLSASTIRFTR